MYMFHLQAFHEHGPRSRSALHLWEHSLRSLVQSARYYQI